MARQAHAAHHVGIEEPLPLGIIDLRERFGAKDAETINQDIDLWLYRNHPGYTIRSGQARRDPENCCALDGEFDLADSFVYALLRTPVNGHARAEAR